MPGREAVALRVERELSSIRDPALLTLARSLLVDPYPVEREWDYGAPGQKYVCWTVIEHRPFGTGVAYCELGFGPAFPWGIVFLDGPHMNIGMDSAWYASLEDAVRQSPAWDGENPAGYEVT